MFLTCDLHINKNEIRILECLNFLTFLKDECLRTGDKTIAFLGDIFDYSSSIKSSCFVVVFNKFLELKEAGITMIFIPGNHDKSTKDGSGTLVETFKSFGKFIQKSETVTIDGYDYDFLAYTDSPDDIPHSAGILLTHLSIDGYWIGGGINQGCFDGYELVVSGHVHKFQSDGKFFFVGAPYSTNKGETEYRHGYARISGMNIEHLDYNDAPEYMTISAEHFDSDIDYRNKMVTVEISSKIENFVKLRDILYDRGAITVEPIFIKEAVQERQVTEIDTSEGVVKSVTRYISGLSGNGIDSEKLLTCFKKILENCPKSVRI